MRKPVISVLSFAVLLVPVLTIVGVLRSMEILADTKPSVLWVEFLVKSKGDDYLFVVDPSADGANKKPRRIRCLESLPDFVESTDAIAKQTDGRLIGSVRGFVRQDVDGERIDDLEVLCLTLVARGSVSRVAEQQGRFEEPIKKIDLVDRK